MVETGGNLLTTAEVARIFNVHTATIRRWCRQGRLACRLTGPRGTRRFRHEDVAITGLDRYFRQYFTGR